MRTPLCSHTGKTQPAFNSSFIPPDAVQVARCQKQRYSGWRQSGISLIPSPARWAQGRGAGRAGTEVPGSHLQARGRQSLSTGTAGMS